MALTIAVSWNRVVWESGSEGGGGRGENGSVGGWLLDASTINLSVGTWKFFQGIASYLLERIALAGLEGMEAGPMEARATGGIGAIFCCFSSMTDKST